LLTLLPLKNKKGTDATIATHIQTIQDRGYAVKQPNGQFTPTNLGIALIEGYNQMGLDLSKPRLRAQMEAEMKVLLTLTNILMSFLNLFQQGISEGKSTRERVVSDNIRMYRNLFVRVVQQASKLDEV